MAFLKRREFLGAAGAGIAALATGTVRAQSAAPIVDFHNHFVGTAFTARAGASAPQAQRARFDKINRNLADAAALLDSIDEAGVAARVINTPLEFIRDADGSVPPQTPQRINDQLAGLVNRHRGRLYALATVDAYSGDEGARELTRAVRELGLRGVFIESTKDGLFPDAKEVRPTLAAAAELNVPVFVHPVNDENLRKQFARYGRLGTTLNRSTVNSAALFAMLESGTFDELPNLRVVVTTLAIGGLLTAGGFGDGYRLRRDTPPERRRHVYVDTMGLHPVLMRSMIDLLGADHVLVGTDWPIFSEKSIPERLQAALTACGLSAAEQQMVRSGNALKLLGAV